MIWSTERFRELNKVNRNVNTRVVYVSDLEHYKKEEYWATALEVLKDKEADCEDYVTMKMGLLRALGWEKEDLNLAICLVEGKGHAVLVASTDKEDYVLDNNTNEVLPWFMARFKWIEMTVKGNFKQWVEILS